MASDTRAYIPTTYNIRVITKRKPGGIISSICKTRTRYVYSAGITRNLLISRPGRRRWIDGAQETRFVLECFRLPFRLPVHQTREEQLEQRAT